MIENRPKELEHIENYRYVKKGQITIDWSKTNQLFLFDMLCMFGLLPIEDRLSEILGHIIPHQPTEECIQYFEKKKAKFQMVNVVVNLFDLKANGGGFAGKPYSISLVPASRKGKLDYISPNFFRNFDITCLENQDKVYLGFNPFEKGYEVYGSLDNLYRLGIAKDYYTDMIGHITDTYFLSTEFEFDQIHLNEVSDGNNYINEKYRKMRIRKYYKEFKDITPRKLWGADSPIELFVIQYLASKNIYPEIQTMIFEDGSIFPSLYDMISENRRNSEIRMITEVDLYFHEKKIAIFCDSNAHHRSKKDRDKDIKISKTLETFGIKSIRINGSDIVERLKETGDKIIAEVFS